MNSITMEQPTLPLILSARLVMKLLSVKKNTLAKWIAEGRLTVLPLYQRKRMFQTEQVLKLVALPK